MKRNYTLLILTIINSFAQTPGGVSSPLAWKKVASNGDSIALRGKGLTFIGVGKVQASDAEQTLWSIGTPTTTSFVQTTSRTANLTKTAFMNYSNDTLPEMRMYSYSNPQHLSPRRCISVVPPISRYPSPTSYVRSWNMWYMTVPSPLQSATG